MASNLVDTVGSAHTIGRTSGRSSRVEVLPRAERRRSWTAEQKLAIVGESLGPDLTPMELARKHRVSTGQLYTWRQHFLGCEAAVGRMAPRFAAVELAPSGASCHPPPLEPSSPCPSPVAPPRPAGLIEVVLPGGVLVRVDASVDAGALRRVLAALDGR